ncbi:hypothetical protein [Winogradskyella sp. Asnod2-B02-A]|uniref:hypothetical protein n=1 Tax=Winogradskyella sp. Asnod2-B02-A TaxID=3160583 RepID=UPI00386D63E7
MKNLTIIFLILIGISANSQTFSVKGIQKYCETDRTDSRERYLSVTRNDSVIVENVKTRFGEFKVKGLKEGFYTFKFTNIFGQIVNYKTEILKNGNQITICVDTFQETNEKTLFSELTSEDKLIIEYASSGCFHFDNEQMKFYYEKEKLIAELYISEKLVKRKKVDSKSLEYLIGFEKKVKQMKNNMGGCTTSDLYVFSLNNETGFSVNDSSCDWNGYRELKKEIFNYTK